MRSAVVGEDRRQDLERNLTAQLGVGGAIDLSHAALAEHLRDAIMRDLFPDQWLDTPSMLFILGRVWSKFNHKGGFRY